MKIQITEAQLKKITEVEQGLNEEVRAGSITIYHRTKLSKDHINKLNHGFIPGDGALYGRGLYSTYEFDSQLTDGMSAYGQIIVEFSVPTSANILVLDESEQKKIFGRAISIEEQLKRILRGNYQKFYSVNQYDLDKYIYNDSDEVNTTSDMALVLSRMKGFALIVDAIIFTGRRDGKVLVLYQTPLANPLRYTIDDGQTWVSLKTKESYRIGKDERGQNKYINYEKSGGSIDDVVYLDKDKKLELIKQKLAKSNYPDFSRGEYSLFLKTKPDKNTLTNVQIGMLKKDNKLESNPWFTNTLTEFVKKLVEKHGVYEVHKTVEISGKKYGIYKNYHDYYTWNTLYFVVGENGLYTGEAIVVNFNSNTGRKESQYKVVNQKKQGKYIKYNEDGSIREILRYSNDVLDGLQEKYYNGKLTRTSNYVNDVLNGEYKTFYNNGQIESIVDYVDGKMHGKELHYSPNGKIQLIRNVENNRANGEEIRYYDDGSKTIATWSNDIMHGPYKKYYSDGNLSVEGQYDNDKMVGEWKMYDKDGLLAQTSDYGDYSDQDDFDDDNINEEVFKYNDLTPDEQTDVYNLFKNSYEKSVGKAWNRMKFDSRANDWTFYGDKSKGFVSVRKQGTGLNKLVGVAGDFKSISIGINEIIALNEPVWGMADKKIVDVLAKRYGFIKPPAFIVKILMKHIPPHVFGNVAYDINSDGSLTFKYSDVGDATKYLFGNKLYFQEIKTNVIDRMKDIPTPVRFLLKKFFNLFI